MSYFGCQPPCQTDQACYGTIGTTCNAATGICPGPDAGAPVVDAGRAPVDAGQTSADAGNAPADAGSNAQSDGGSAADGGSQSHAGGCGCNGLPGSADWSSVSLLLLALVELRRRR